MRVLLRHSISMASIMSVCLPRLWTLNRRPRATHSGSSHPIVVAIAVLACVGLSACTAAEAPSPAETTEASTVPPLPESGDISPGTYLVTSFTENFEIIVPDGWSSEGGEGLGKDDPDHPDEMAVFVGWWPSDHVPTDACAWEGALVEVDPSAKAFVDALTAQTSTASTPPVEVMVGDYSGFEFGHSIEGDVDIAACDRDKFCIHSEFSNECTRWYTTQNERETYRVVDLNGERAMFWVVQFHESINPELTSEARTVFDSIVFRSGK
ncbi:hypothetical protein [Arthrobacter sp. Alg241-R88]|uniref:hypothetical protein n=1 Tax=Arthrobacter sp. Alg241-R88 TaxID=2305984 RepID=UPI001F08061D|nr:hypothetical protein [Arthrobacter sp. Alg241-R88]